MVRPEGELARPVGGDASKRWPRTRSRSRPRRLVADLLILAGLLLLLYPVGTWVYTWWEQRALEQELESLHPLLAENYESYFGSGMVVVDPVEEPQNEVAGAAEAAEARAAQLALFKRAAETYATASLKTGEPMGKIAIPKIGVDAVLIQGTSGKDLREGPGHWPETPLPGLGGNFVVSGHRTTYGAPFFKLDKLVEGDEIQVLLPYVAARYGVTRVVVVRPDQVDTVAQRGYEEISLTTCDPIYSARNRLVVQGRLIEFNLLSEAGPTAP